jgi:hypothetical protein
LIWNPFKAVGVFFCVSNYLYRQNFFNRIEERWSLYPKFNNGLKLFKLLVLILIVNHLFSCAWIYVGEVHKMDPEENSWIKRYELVDASWQIKYLKSFYFMTVTMITVGYGDIVPISDLETLVAIISMLIACGVFAYTVNAIGMIIQDFFHEEE